MKPADDWTVVHRGRVASISRGHVHLDTGVRLEDGTWVEMTLEQALPFNVGDEVEIRRRPGR